MQLDSGGAFETSSFGSCASSLALDTDEAMSASSKMAQDVRCPNRLGLLWQRGRKETGGALPGGWSREAGASVLGPGPKADLWIQ